MTYRAYKEPKPRRRRTMAEGSTPAVFYVANGTTADFALPCYYLELQQPIHAHPHCRDHHDHIGWPDPRHPDRSCQPHEWAHACDGRHHLHEWLDPDLLSPIRLEDEGYTAFSVNTPTDMVDDLEAEAVVDESQFWVVRLYVTAKSQDALIEHVDVPFSIVGSRVDGSRTLSNQFAHGIIRILPAQLGI